MSNSKVNDDFQIHGFFSRTSCPSLKNTIKDTWLLIKALFRSEAELKDLKNMHKKTLHGVFRRHFAWMEASKSYISNYLYEFAAIISRQNICEQAISCFILTKRTSLILGLLTFKKHISVSLGFRFVCAWADRSRAVSRTPQFPHTLLPSIALSCDSLCAQVKHIPCISEVTALQPATAAFPAACPIKAFISTLCSAAKQQSKVHENEYC